MVFKSMYSFIFLDKIIVNNKLSVYYLTHEYKSKKRNW